MNISKNGVRGLVAAGAIAMGVTPVLAATNGAASVWKNCTSVQTRYPHGVGTLRAHDRTSGTPVTTFKRSTQLYNVAMSYNRGLDRDKDGIACEKR